jgi:lipopolysaccharide export system protein LptA
MFIRNLFLIFFFSILSLPIFGQSKIKYSAEGRQEVFKWQGQRLSALVEGVVFTQKTTTVTCDSAVHYGRENKMEAFFNIRIVDEKTTITSNRLVYEGDSRTAFLREKVVYRDGKRRMYTDSLDYDLDKEIAIYRYGGKLEDSVNTLTSNKGFFYSQENYAVFYGNVELIAPDYILKTDTLKYNTNTKVAYTEGRTEIIKEDNTTLHAQGGVFRTYIDQSQFVDGNVETDDYFLEGDQLFFDDLNKYYKAEGNVKLIAKSKDVIIIGEEAYYDKTNGLSKVYGNPVMKRILVQDTFYLAADTLIAVESEYDSMKRILAHPDIRIFKKNLQGISDSAAYFLRDSLIFMYDDPVLWAKGSQIEADTINLEVSENSIKSMNLRQNAFLISQDTLNNYNQVKGRNMKAYFENGDLMSIDVNGNGETIFHILGEGDSTLLGLNRLLCSNMLIGFVDNDITEITVYKQPEGKIIPPHEITEKDIKLQGFDWRFMEKPDLSDIFKKPGEEDKETYPGVKPDESTSTHPEKSTIGSKKDLLKNPNN